MATISWVVFKHHKKADGTYNPKIRISHNSQSAYIATNIFTELVKFKKGASSGTVTSGNIMDSLNDIVKSYRDILNNNQDVIKSCETAKELLTFLERKTKRGEDVDFIKFARKNISEIKNEGTQTVKTTGINALCHYLDHLGVKTLYVKNISSKFLRGYEKWLREERVLVIKGKKSTRKPLNDTGVHTFMSTIQSIFNNALQEYNDYELGDIVITNNPFKAYKIPSVMIAEKRALEPSTIKKIFSYSNDRKKTPTLARDVFMLSFFLAGINSADLFTCTSINNNRLEYNRKKTEGRRLDKAFISVGIIPEAQNLIDKYRDVTNERIFNFYQRYSGVRELTKGLHRGLRIICNDLGLDPIQFYAARHSFATIARNDCGISKDDIALCLNHSSGDTITDTYIKKDFTRIDEVIRKVVDYVFKDE